MEDDARVEVARLMAEGRGDRYIARVLGITRHGARMLMQKIDPATGLRQDHKGDTVELSGSVRATSQSQALEALLHDADVDMEEWTVTRWVANMWGQPGNPQWQVKAWLSRKPVETRFIEELLEEISKHGPIVTKPLERINKGPRLTTRALEISIADPHFGMRCFRGPSGSNWDPAIAEDTYFATMTKLIKLAYQFGPFDQIFFVTGNDFMHADNVFHTTTQGTTQPEMDSWHHTLLHAERTLIRAVEKLKLEADIVRVIMVPGNHARQTEFMLGRVLHAYYRNDDSVWVDAGPEPYKFFRFGTNLIGLDHGHSINPVKLGGIMAGERKEDWAYTTYREWHLGDQHRKGVSSPSMEELGVSIEYLPSLVPWNEWHKIKGFSQQKRAAVAFVYDEDEGCIAKLQVNVP